MGNYCVPIHVPIYVDGNNCFVATDWMRSLELLRDSLSETFSRFTLLAPSQQAAQAKISLEPISSEDGFNLMPSISTHLSKREYFLRARAQWRRDVAAALDDCDFAHTAISDLYKPMGSDAIALVRRRRIPSAFYMDTDIIEQQRNLIDSGLMRSGPDRAIYLWIYERHVRRVVGDSTVSMLKGSALWNRYARYSKNPRLFHDTSYHSREIVAEDMLEKRLASRRGGELRLVYCGRLAARKGCREAIDIVDRARRLGARITFDLIGDGEERDALEAQVERLNQSGAIRFLGERSYGPELLRTLSSYDALLFTPIAEDTPRMIFDGYAAGLPVVGHDISYIKERAVEEEATVLLPSGRADDAARVLARLAEDRERLVTLTRNALKAGHSNSTDVWYKRRAEWTIEAYRASRR